MVVKPTEGKKGLAIPQRYWDIYCSAAPPRPTWPEHIQKLEAKRLESNATRGVPRHREQERGSSGRVREGEPRSSKGGGRFLSFIFFLKGSKVGK